MSVGCRPRIERRYDNDKRKVDVDFRYRFDFLYQVYTSKVSFSVFLHREHGDAEGDGRAKHDIRHDMSKF